jgi:hypothetical protein
LPEKEKKLILDQIEIASENNNINNNSIKLIIENEKDIIEKNKQEIDKNKSKPPEEVFSNLLDLMDSKLNEIFTQAQDSQINTKLEVYFYSLCLRVVTRLIIMSYPDN